MVINIKIFVTTCIYGILRIQDYATSSLVSATEFNSLQKMACRLW